MSTLEQSSIPLNRPESYMTKYNCTYNLDTTRRKPLIVDAADKPIRPRALVPDDAAIRTTPATSAAIARGRAAVLVAAADVVGVVWTSASDRPAARLTASGDRGADAVEAVAGIAAIVDGPERAGRETEHGDNGGGGELHRVLVDLSCIGLGERADRRYDEG